MTVNSESDFDPNKVDEYANHLAEVNKSKQVIATADICNDQGAILIKKGSAIDNKSTERIVKFKLLKPLEDSVSIDGDIDGATLFQDLIDLININPLAKKIHEQLKLHATIKILCQNYQKFPILRQKTTVLSMQMERVYKQSLFSAWITVIIAQQLKLSINEVNELFIAAISHDIGMLHISREILDKKQDLTPEEWRQIYAHPIISEKILNNIPGIEKNAKRAVREHHEYSDGTGYPSGKFEKDLSKYGQIIAMADSSVGILVRLQKEGRNFRDLMPVLQINSQAHSYGIYEAFIVVLRKANLGDEGIVSSEAMPQFIDNLLLTNSLLSDWLKASESSILPLGFDHNDRELHKIQTVLMNIAIAVRGAGILDDGYLRFLEQVKKESLTFAYREIEDVSIMLNELRFQLNRLTRLMNDYIEFQDEAPIEILQSLKKGITLINKVKKNHAEKDPAQFSI